jgi:hypothetical protein
MATMLLAAAGSAIGSAFGGAFLGFSAATIGGAIGSFAGSVIDSLIIGSLAPDQRIEGAKLDDLRLTSATEGAVIPRLYGTMRLGGNIIWATDFREEQFRQTQGGGKGGGPKVVTEGYRYYASFAVALCEGPIGGVCRIWADGKPFDVPGAVIRVHLGTESQMPDPFIEMKEGAGQAPAYRGVAYVVFEDLALESFGNRLPQLSFEVIRPSPDPAAMERLVRAVNLIPSAGEFVYATQTVTRTTAAPGLWNNGGGNGTAVPENENSVEGLPDLVASLNRLDAALPECEAVSLVVSWFGTDLRAGACQIKPGVESTTKTTTPMVWQVNGVTRTSAHVVSTVDGGPAYGGTPTDAAVVQAIQDLKARGKRVTFYPFILMDIPAANTLPNPYSPNGTASGQPVYPWRGRITCAPAPGFAGTVDKTASAASQVASFFGSAAPGQFAVSGTTVGFTGSPSDWGQRRMILHYAHLCAAAGGVDAFLIGTEMRGLTQIRSGASTYPAVTAFVQLAADVSAILGPATKVSQRPVATITLDSLVAASREAEDLEMTRAQETELPLALKWRLMARDEEFAGITVEARRITVDTARISAEQLPIASTSGAAERGVRRALFEAWVGREKASFTLPPSRLALDPADVILLDHDNRLIEFALTTITDGAGRRVEARRSDRAIYDLAPGSDRGATSGAKAVYGPPLVALMNLPQLSEDFPDWQPYAAAHAAPWYGTAAVWRSASTDGFAVLTTISRPGWFGTLAFPFYSGPTNRFDRGNELWVDMIAGQFASVSDAAVYSGTNWLAIETAPDLWEIIGFATASLQSPGRWRLTRLLRGLLGTEDAIANPAPAGARVVVLDGGVKALPIGSADYGAAWNWRIGASSKPSGDPANLAVTFAPTARGLRPWRPCHARRVNLPGGDIALSWIRRTRAFAGDNWALTEVPLGEAAEGYELDILNGAVVVRTVSGLTAPAFIYTAAMQTADFGALVSGPLALRIAQTGALGRGAILDITV